MSPPIEGPPMPATRSASGREYDAAYSRRVMIVLAGLVMTVMYVEGMLTPSLPTIQKEFGITSGAASLILSSYLITGVALSPVVGKLGDIYGKKRVLGYVLIIYSLCVSVTGFSPSFAFMIGARTFQGIGLTVFPLGMSLVREEFPREMVPRAQGILSSLFGAGFAISLPLGAWVSNNYGWRTTYHTAIPVVVLLAVLVFVLIRESVYRRPETRVDYGGATLLGGALALTVLALSEGESWGWSSVAFLGVMGMGLLLLVPLVLYETRWTRTGGEGILDLRLLRMRNVLVTNLVVLIAGSGMYLAMLSVSYLYQTASPVGYGFDISLTGDALVPLAIGMLIFAPIAGIIVSRIGTKPLTAIGATVGSVGFALGAWVIPMHNLAAFLAIEFLIGSGIAILNAAVINLLILTVEPRDMGLATAMNSVFRNVGSSIGAPIAGSLLATWTWTYVVPHYGPVTAPATLAFQWAFGIAAIVFVAAGVVVVFAQEVLGRKSVVSRPSAALPSARSGTAASVPSAGPAGSHGVSSGAVARPCPGGSGGGSEPGVRPVQGAGGPHPLDPSVGRRLAPAPERARR